MEGAWEVKAFYFFRNISRVLLIYQWLLMLQPFFYTCFHQR